MAERNSAMPALSAAPPRRRAAATAGRWPLAAGRWPLAASHAATGSGSCPVIAGQVDHGALTS